MLHFTGHPLVDIGVAALVALADKDSPEELTSDDLASIAEYLVRTYVHGGMTSFLSSVFTMNSVYTQPSWKTEQRENEARKFLADCLDHSGESVNRDCVFSGEQATRFAYRQHVPMLTGENVLNFFPDAQGGLPVAGKYLFALQAFPLAARRCLGRALAVHSSDDTSLIQHFANRFVRDNQRLLLLAQQSGEKYFDTKAAKTFILHSLSEIESGRQLSLEGPSPSISVYFFTNDGREPKIELFHLPSELVAFLRKANRDATQSIWRSIQQRAWHIERDSEKKKASTSTTLPAEDPETNRNYLFEDYFQLPYKAPSFIRRYFLRSSYKAGQPAADISTLARELNLVSWEITSLFLKEIMGMQKRRVEETRQLADKIAEYVKSENDRRFFRRLYLAHRYVDLRNAIIKVSGNQVKTGAPPLVTFDEFVQVFEADDEFKDWSLIRDLLLIRVIESLHQSGWFTQETTDLLEQQEDEELQSA